jgi:hypothetical protein
MSAATAEKHKPNPAQRLEILQRELARRRGKLEAITAEIDELTAGQQAVVTESLRADPTRSAFQRGAPAQERERKQVELEKTASHLRQEILALTGEADAVAAEVAARDLAEATKEGRRLSARELELRRDFGETFAKLAQLSNELMANLAARGVLVAEVNRAELPRRIGIFDAPAVVAWEAASVPAVQPPPGTFRELLVEALEASTGERSSDEDPEALRAVNQHRASLGLAPELRSVPPSRQALEASYPDLREIVRTADTGEQPGEMIEGLAEAGFGATGDVQARPMTPSEAA